MWGKEGDITMTGNPVAKWTIDRVISICTAPLHPMPYDAQILVIVTRYHSHCNLLFAVSRDITVHVIRAAEHSKFGF